MASEKISDIERLPSETYEYGFKDDIDPVVQFEKGLSEAVVREISSIKNEPQWMLEKRLQAYHHFMKSRLPNLGSDLSDLDFGDYSYYL